jgi:hypothetical protein
MRRALLRLLIVPVLLLTPSAGAAFGCFDTPGQGRKCACIGENDCDGMEQSGSCKSNPDCDKSELGALVCSCKAARGARTR